MCVSNFSTNSEIFLIVRRVQRDTVINIIRLQVKCPLFFSDFNESPVFSTNFRKIFSLKFHEIRSSGAELLDEYEQTDGQT